jgi:Asp-tRNA(Asn)/Glu-tRNA(Gln) amidotransferase A subunit family amidase
MSSGISHLDEVSIEHLRASIRAADLSCLTQVEANLARIDALDRNGPRIVSTDHGALLDADAPDGTFAAAGEPAGPLHGEVVLVKDRIATTPIPTTYGSELFRGFSPDREATIVSKPQRAGAVLLAKTALSDLVPSWLATQLREMKQEPLRSREGSE